MQTIENEVASGKTISMDDKNFVNCRFSNCKLIYSGGDCTWVTSAFPDCQIMLSGAAQRTAAFLAGFGVLPGGTQLPPTGQPESPKKPNGGTIQ
jgi:hypothetical protein